MHQCTAQCLQVWARVTLICMIGFEDTQSTLAVGPLSHPEQQLDMPSTCLPTALTYTRSWVWATSSPSSHPLLPSLLHLYVIYCSQPSSSYGKRPISSLRNP
eukprot:scpid111587/ scgid6330/ 